MKRKQVMIPALLAVTVALAACSTPPNANLEQRACSRLAFGGVEQAARATVTASRAGIITCLRFMISSF